MTESDAQDTRWLNPDGTEMDGYAGSANNLGGVSLTSDNVFGDDGGIFQIATVTGDVSQGYTATLAVGI